MESISINLGIVIGIIVACAIREYIMFRKLPSDNYDAGYKAAVNEFVENWNMNVKLDDATRLLKIKMKVKEMCDVYSKRQSDSGR